MNNLRQILGFGIFETNNQGDFNHAVICNVCKPTQLVPSSAYGKSSATSINDAGLVVVSVLPIGQVPTAALWNGLALTTRALDRLAM